MSVEKLSISLPAPLGAAIRAAAEADRITVSAWFAGAARERLQAAAAQSEALAAAEELLAEIEADQGPATSAERRWVADVLAAAGLATRAAS